MKLCLITASLALAGCSNLLPSLENRLTCAVAKDKAFVVSQYGPVGISSVIADQDRAEICYKLPNVAPVK